MFGLSTTDASSASLLLNLEGVATMAIAWIVFRENVDSRLLLGAAAILAGAVLLSWSGEGLRLSWGSLLIAGGLPRLGHRQQPDAQALLLRSRADRRDQGAGGGCGEHGAGDLSSGRRCVSPAHGGGGGRHRLLRDRREPRLLHAGAPPSRHGSHGRLLLAGAVHRCFAVDRHAGRSGDPMADRRRRLDGDWPLASPCRTP